jgi:predicted permease
VIVAHLPQTFLQIGDLHFDPRVLWFTAAISMLTGVLFGLAPAASSARGELAQSLRAGERGGGSQGQRRLGRFLVIGEVAAVLVLLIGAGLVLRSLGRLTSINPGFQSRDVIAWQMFLPTNRYPDAAAQRAFFGRVLEQAQSLPGVRSAGLVQPPPFGPIVLVADSSFLIAGRSEPSPDQMPEGLITRADSGYFTAMQIPVHRGRVFTAQDNELSNSVVISDALQRLYFPNQDPIGQRLLLGRRHFEMQIVGVVGDVKHNNLRNNLRPEFYLPLARFTPGAVALIVKTAEGASSAILPGLQKRVWSLDSAMAGNLVLPVDTLLHDSLAADRLATVLFAIFAAATLALGLIGVYGVLSYSVRQRTREIGIRLALGASPKIVLRMVLGEALRLAGAGVVAGFFAALILSRYLQSLLFGVTPFDPLTYAIAVLSLPLAAMLAAYIPAIRATRIDPATSLKAE